MHVQNVMKQIQCESLRDDIVHGGRHHWVSARGVLHVTNRSDGAKSRVPRTKQAATHISLVSIVYNRRQALVLTLHLLHLPLFEPVNQPLHDVITIMRRDTWRDMLDNVELTTSSSSHDCPSVFVQRSLPAQSHLFSFPTFTVAIILTSGPGTDSAKQVNSKKLECSEYGTPAVSVLLHNRPRTNDRPTPPQRKAEPVCRTAHSPYIMNCLQLPRIGFKLASPNVRL